MKECFVIMPIGSGDGYAVYRNRYEEMIKPAVDGMRVDGAPVFKCVRADFVSESGSITRDVLSRLYRADAVIADLTDLNPNVFYELGVRHALRSGTILVGLRGTKPPFDLGDLRVIYYDDRLGGEKIAVPQIREALQSLLQDGGAIDSPVLHAIPQLNTRRSAKELEANVAALEQEVNILRAQLEVSEKSSLANQGTLEALRQAVESLTSRLTDKEKEAAEARIENVARTREPAAIQPLALRGIPVESSAVFVLMPLRPEFEDVYQMIVDAGEKVGLRVFRADAIAAAGRIIDQVFEAIAKSGLVLADLTGRNQNVMYELGVANAMGKETLLISQTLDDVPFDLRHIRVLMYKQTLRGSNELSVQLERAFRDYVARRDKNS